MQLCGLVFSMPAASVAGAALRNENSTQHSLDINQKVYIDAAPVLGDGSGDALLKECTELAQTADTTKVDGTGIQLKTYLRNRCTEYYTHQVTVGKCNKGDTSATCDTVARTGVLDHYQSYEITQC